MRPLEISLKIFLMLGLCDQCYILLLFVCDGSMWNQYSNCLCISLCIYLMYFASWYENSRKCHCIANGLNAFHVYTHVLHAICDGMAIGQYSSIIFIYLLNCDIFVL